MYNLFLHATPHDVSFSQSTDISLQKDAQPIPSISLLDTEPSKIHSLMQGHGMSHTLRRVSNQLGSVTVHHLGVSRLWGISHVLSEGKSHNIRPLLHGLLHVGVTECGVGGSVPAA
jgi:hypothetical protein